jgi:hypothetical protein
MVDEQKNSSETPRAKRTKKLRILPAPREQSTIQFPYMDLETGISVARTILTAGGVALTREQLAGVMGQTVTSGNFIMKTATARMFGLVNFGVGKYELSDLGFSVLDDTDERRQKAARAAAFLSVPLYKRTYEEFRGKQLPPRPFGLEQAFVKFGVVQKQKANARLAFDKSAQQAGFFANGTDRLIEPIIGPERGRIQVDELDFRDPANPPPGFEPPASFRTPTKAGGLHPFIQGLLDTLPEPNTNWAIEGRAKWLQAAANIFDLIYQGNGEIDIRAKTGDASLSDPRREAAANEAAYKKQWTTDPNIADAGIKRREE